jgi:hypothetical protein
MYHQESKCYSFFLLLFLFSRSFRDDLRVHQKRTLLLMGTMTVTGWRRNTKLAHRREWNDFPPRTAAVVCAAERSWLVDVEPAACTHTTRLFLLAEMLSYMQQLQVVERRGRRVQQLVSRIRIFSLYICVSRNKFS